jgi:hypothetical protein
MHICGRVLLAWLSEAFQISESTRWLVERKDRVKPSKGQEEIKTTDGQRLESSEDLGA